MNKTPKDLIEEMKAQGMNIEEIAETAIAILDMETSRMGIQINPSTWKRHMGNIMKDIKVPERNFLVVAKVLTQYILDKTIVIPPKQ